MRILITGSRTWTDKKTIHDAIHAAVRMHRARNVGSTRRVTIVHGGADGADKLAAEWTWDLLGTNTEEHRADWAKYGRRAGMVRNQAMVDLGADLCLAFIRDNSPGATACAAMAERAGIPTVRVPWPEKSSAYDLWVKADGHPQRYRELLLEHGLLIPLKPGETAQPLPCGWPHKRTGEASR